MGEGKKLCTYVMCICKTEGSAAAVISSKSSYWHCPSGMAD